MVYPRIGKTMDRLARQPGKRIDEIILFVNPVATRRSTKYLLGGCQVQVVFGQITSYLNRVNYHSATPCPPAYVPEPEHRVNPFARRLRVDQLIGLIGRRLPVARNNFGQTAVGNVVTGRLRSDRRCTYYS